MRFRDRGGRVPADVLARADLPRGEKVLAHTVAKDGTWLLGTRLRLVVVGGGELPEEQRAVQIPWETVEDAAWKQDDARLRFTETGQYGEPRPTYSFEVEDPALLLQLVRERVTASVVLQRRVPVRGRLGLTCDRPPQPGAVDPSRGCTPTTWAWTLPIRRWPLWPTSPSSRRRQRSANRPMALSNKDL